MAVVAQALKEVERHYQSGSDLSVLWASVTAITEVDALVSLGEFDEASAAILKTRELGGFAKAVADETAALAKEPDDAGSLYVRGVARLRLGEKLAGNADIEAARKIAPNIAEIYAKYGVR